MVYVLSMAPVKPGSYTFRKESLVEIRQRLGLSQVQMAAKLGVPKNTVSRWETGATVPHADSLAAIYSVAREKGIMPTFFAPEKLRASIRDTALVYWDIDSVAPYGGNLGDWDTFVVTEVDKRVPGFKHSQFKVFTGIPHTPAVNRLEDLDWDIWEGDPDIVHHALSESGQKPDASVVFLITTRPDYADLIKRLKDEGVRVYLMAPSSVSDVLVEAVGRKRWLNLDGLPGLPIVIKADPLDFLL